jgi:archaemetzincin
MGIDIVDKGSERLVKEAVHELGHCFNLRHCKDSMCLMHYCRKLDDVDQKTDQFCRYCDIILTDSIRALNI